MYIYFYSLKFTGQGTKARTHLLGDDDVSGPLSSKCFSSLLASPLMLPPLLVLIKEQSCTLTCPVVRLSSQLDSSSQMHRTMQNQALQVMFTSNMRMGEKIRCDIRDFWYAQHLVSECEAPASCAPIMNLFSPQKSFPLVILIQGWGQPGLLSIITDLIVLRNTSFWKFPRSSCFSTQLSV